MFLSCSVVSHVPTGSHLVWSQLCSSDDPRLRPLLTVGHGGVSDHVGDNERWSP